MNKPVPTKEPIDGQPLASFEPGARVLLNLSDATTIDGIVLGPSFVPGEVRVLWSDDQITHIRTSVLEPLEPLEPDDE